MRNLNLWNRLGIVLTVLWLATAPLAFVGRDNYNFSKFLDTNTSLACWKLAKGVAPEKFQSELKYCLYIRNLVIDNKIQDQLSYATYFGFSLSVAVAVWLLAYIATFAARWVWAGRKRDLSN